MTLIAETSDALPYAAGGLMLLLWAALIAHRFARKTFSRREHPN
jgi:hypothetical protein